MAPEYLQLPQSQINETLQAGNKEELEGMLATVKTILEAKMSEAIGSSQMIVTWSDQLLNNYGDILPGKFIEAISMNKELHIQELAYYAEYGNRVDEVQLEDLLFFMELGNHCKETIDTLNIAMGFVAAAIESEEDAGEMEDASEMEDALEVEDTVEMQDVIELDNAVEMEDATEMDSAIEMEDAGETGNAGEMEDAHS